MTATPPDCVVFRVDGGGTIGAGHIMRCLTLADALAERGTCCHFLSFDSPKTLKNAIETRGHGFHDIVSSGLSVPDKGAPVSHSAWLAHSQHDDAIACAPHLKLLQPDWLVVDHYGMDARWQKDLAHLARHQMSIDDLADRSFISDLHVDPNPNNASLYECEKLLPVQSKRLLGCKYALLRPEFTNHSGAKEVRESDLSLVVMMGGVDLTDVTGQLLGHLAAQPKLLKPIDHVTVVVGPASPNQESVKRSAEALPCATDVLVNPQNIASILAKADICIGAAGGSAWERCAVGLPSLMVVLAANQRGIADYLVRSGAALSVKLGDCIAFDQAFYDLCDPERRRLLSKNAMALVDGAGTERVIDVMIETQ